MNKRCSICGYRVHNNTSLCLVHLMDRRSRYKRWYENNKEKIRKIKREYGKKRYKILKEKGLCVYCGKNKVFDSSFSCNICESKRISNSKKKHNKRHLRELNCLCLICGNQRYKNFRCCKSCYERLEANRKKGRN